MPMDNLQQLELEDEEIQQILNQSINLWLNKAQIISLFQHHLESPFPISNIFGGPFPRIQGLFLYDERSFADHYLWENVNQARRLNCKSRNLGSRVYPRVNYTVATAANFRRRTHRVTGHENVNLVNLAFVHYREVAVAPDPEAALLVVAVQEQAEPVVVVAEPAVVVAEQQEAAEEDVYVQAEEGSASAISGGGLDKKVVLLGTDSFLKNLNNSQYEVQILSPRNYFAFTPLLPSVTCGTVEARSVVEPIRNIGKKKNVDASYLEAECVKIDPASKKVFCRSKQGLDSNGKKEFSVDCDYLVIATGAHFVVVGGGPTGVEFAAELHDFVTEDQVKLYPRAKDSVRITLLGAGADHILTMFDKRIAEFAEEKFSRDGIDVKLGSMVTKVNEKDISAKTKAGEVSSVPYGMIVWSTGIGTRPVIKDFMKQIGQGNRRALATDEWLGVQGCDNIYAVGDCATINQRKVMEDVSAIFTKADTDKSGTLTLKEFEEAEIEYRELLWHGSRLTYLTVPTQYVFLVRFIKASMSDPEMENMVHFLAELGLMHYETLKFCPSMLAASAVYTARCSLNKSPAWTDTLKFHTGYSESEIMECSKVLGFHHSRCGESRLRAVYKKYSKAEKGGVALVSAAKSLLS